MTVRLDGIDLAQSNLGNTLAATGRSVEAALFEMLGYDAVSGVVLPGGGLAATPMARLRERTRDVLIEEGSSADEADRALDAAWHAPDPVGLALVRVGQLLGLVLPLLLIELLRVAGHEGLYVDGA